MENALSQGKAILELIYLAHAIIGPFVLILYGVYLFLGCIGFFNGMELLTILSGKFRCVISIQLKLANYPNFNMYINYASPPAFLRGSAAFCFLCLSYMAVYSLARAGQKLAELYRWATIMLNVNTKREIHR